MSDLKTEDETLASTYVIYARKSSDESTGKQYRSIEDQLKYCHELADKQGITVKKEHIFCESGSCSAKKAGKRPLFKKIVEMIGGGKIDGIITWHPDRLSRNMLEAGIIIDLIDEEKITDIKFCTHHFENTASGKMMLGIMFAISKEYTDKLSVDVSRGIGGNLKEGKSQGAYKWGYERSKKDGFYYPHKQFFPIIQEVWRMRLQKQPKTYSQIEQWLENMGIYRDVESKDKETGKTKVNSYKPNLTKIFKDTIYYGVLSQKEKGVLREKTLSEFQEFEPIVTKGEWDQVVALSRKRNKRTKQKHFYPFRDDVVTCACGAACFPTTGKKYLYIKCRKWLIHQKNGEKYSMRSNIIMKAIAKKLKQDFKPTRTQHEEYMKVMSKAIDGEVHDNRSKRTELRKGLTKAENDLEDWNLKGIECGKMDNDTKKTYEQKKFILKEKVRVKKEELKELEEKDVLKSFDYEHFSNFVRNVDKYWKKANPEQKHQLVQFLFSNIVVRDGKVLTLAYKPLIAKLFVVSGGPDQI